MVKYGKFLIALFLLGTLSLLSLEKALSAEPDGQFQEKIRIVFEDGEAIVKMLDNPLAKEFMKRLPLNVVLEDFSQTEKIFYLHPRLKTAGGVNADQIKGDFCYFAPWGNIAIFYKGFGHGTSLFVLGRLESGKEELSAKNGKFSARIEKN